MFGIAQSFSCCGSNPHDVHSFIYNLLCLKAMRRRPFSPPPTPTSRREATPVPKIRSSKRSFFVNITNYSISFQKYIDLIIRHFLSISITGRFLHPPPSHILTMSRHISHFWFESPCCQGRDHKPSSKLQKSLSSSDSDDEDAPPAKQQQQEKKRIPRGKKKQVGVLERER